MVLELAIRMSIMLRRIGKEPDENDFWSKLDAMPASVKLLPGTLCCGPLHAPMTTILGPRGAYVDGDTTAAAMEMTCFLPKVLLAFRCDCVRAVA